MCLVVLDTEINPLTNVFSEPLILTKTYWPHTIMDCTLLEVSWRWALQAVWSDTMMTKKYKHNIVCQDLGDTPVKQLVPQDAQGMMGILSFNTQTWTSHQYNLFHMCEQVLLTHIARFNVNVLLICQHYTLGDATSLCFVSKCTLCMKRKVQFMH